MTDAEYEKRLHNIYLKHYKKPISYADWNQQVQNLAKKHQLKHRDNMWDLSDSFFQNPLYWSKLWMINSHVENPHRIYKGDFLKLDPASLSKITKAKQGVNLEELFPEDLVIPASKAKPALKESEFPSSLPQLNLLSHLQDFKTGIDFSKLDFHLPGEKAPTPFYLMDSPPSKAGQIISQNSYGKRFGVTGEVIVVRLNQSASIGTYFTVYRNRGRPTGLLPGFIIRNEYEIQVKGVLKIVAYVQGSGQLYKAQVMSALDALNKKDSIFKGLPPSYSFSVQKKGSGEGRLIGSPYKDRLFLTAGSVVYLDQGSANGLYPNDTFYIQAKKSKAGKFFKRPYHQELSEVGMLKVVASTPSRSTAIIIRAKDSIYVGDAFTGALKGIEVEGIEDWEGINQEGSLLQDLEEVPNYNQEFPQRPKDEDLQQQFEGSGEENPFYQDFEEVETSDSYKEINIGDKDKDQALKEEFDPEGEGVDIEDYEAVIQGEDGKWIEEGEEKELVQKGWGEIDEEDEINEEEIPKNELGDFEEIDVL